MSLIDDNSLGVPSCMISKEDHYSLDSLRHPKEEVTFGRKSYQRCSCFDNIETWTKFSGSETYPLTSNDISFS